LLRFLVLSFLLAAEVEAEDIVLAVVAALDNTLLWQKILHWLKHILLLLEMAAVEERPLHRTDR